MTSDETPAPGVSAPAAAAGHTRPLGVALMVFSSILVCFGQLMWKLGASHGLAWIAGGLVLYGMGAIVMLVAYRFGELSILQPILGLSYALSLVLGALWLGERVTVGRVLGVVAVTLGVAALALNPPARRRPRGERTAPAGPDAPGAADDPGAPDPSGAAR